MRPIRLSVFGSLALAGMLAAGGCSKSTASGDFPDDPAPSTPNTPTPNTPNTPNNPGQPKANYAGVYQANAPVDFTQNGVLPGLTSPLLGSLAIIHDDPGHAIVNFAKAANVPVIKSMPDFLLTVLAALITQQMNGLLASHPEFDQILDTIMNIFEITKTGILANKLTVHTPAADGSVALAIETNGVSFQFLGNKVDTLIPAAAQANARSSMTGVLKPRPNAPVADADLTLTGGSIELPIGDVVIQAMGPLLFQPVFGVNDLKSTLLKLVPCDDLAVYVADAARGNAALSAFINEGTMKAICTAAVGFAADKAISEIQQLKLSGVTIMNGRAVLYDTSQLKPTMDHQSDRVADGTWTWSFGSIDVPSTLVGDRVATSN